MQAKKQLADTPFRFGFRLQKQYCWMLLFLALVGGGMHLLDGKRLLPINTVHILGDLTHINRAGMTVGLQALLGESLLDFDIHNLQKRLSHQPWLDSVSVRRAWPNRLDITITEKVPVARWGDQHLLSDKAVVYPADTQSFQRLPLLYAEKHHAAQLLQQYYHLNRRFQALNERIAVLHQNGRGALDVELASGLKIRFGREAIDPRIDRLIAVYAEHIQPRRSHIQQLDLRYANGFAIAWKEAILKDKDPAFIWSSSHV